MKIYKKFKNYFRSSSPFYYRKMNKYKTPIKYVISGSTAAFVDLAMLYILIDVFGVHYLLSAGIAFLSAFFISFYLQKFWTFRDNGNKKIYKQMFLYLFVGLVNLGINVCGMYFLVEHIFLEFIYFGKFNITYILSQAIMGSILAVGSFLIYRFVIFRKRRKELKLNKNRNNLKILIATGIFPPDIGGPAKYAKSMADEFSRRGCETKVLSYKLEKKLPMGIRHFLYFLRVIFSIRKINLIIALDTFSVGLPAVLAAKIFNKKIIIRTGGDFLWETYVERTGDMVLLVDFYGKIEKLNRKEKIIFKLTKFLLRDCNSLVFSSSYQRKIFVENYLLDESKIYVIENFYGNKILSNNPERKNFISAGRPLKLKNILMLERVFDKAKKENPKIVLEKLEKSSHEELMEKIKNCYAVVLPSLSEVSPNFILEVIKFNKPFILTKDTGLYDRIKDIGIFVNPLDENDIKNKILFLAEDKNYNEHKSRIENFNFTHSWQEIADEFLKIYENL